MGYGICFVITLYLVLLINIQTSDVTKLKINSRGTKHPPVYDLLDQLSSIIEYNNYITAIVSM